MRRLHVGAVFVVLFSAGTCAQSARADEKDADAERLFREGQKLLEERRYGEACPKFEAAYQKDQKLGTLLNLAFCHKEQGNTWYAWLEFREAEVKADEQHRPERKEFARKRIDELEKGLSKAIVDNPAHVALTEVDVEDRKVPEADKGVAFAVEEGKRKVTFKARGKKPATSLITIAKSEKLTHIVVPDLEDAPPVEATPLPQPEPAPQPKPEQEDRGGAQRTLGWIGIGVGGAAAVAGGVFGILTLTNACAHLGTGQCTTSARSREDTTGLVATIAIPVGVALAGGGLILLLTAPKAPPSATVAPALGLGYAGVRGSF
ncbi:MAG TPA: hypothetical protein VIF62_10600 [Labilithrix sp.]|jgi:hypothetical protein